MAPQVRLRMRPADPARARHALGRGLRSDATVSRVSPGPLTRSCPIADTIVSRAVNTRGPRVCPRQQAPEDYERAGLFAHSDEDATPSPQAGRPWASGQLVFNCSQFESARSGFADYAREGETARELRARLNRMILEDS